MGALLPPILETERLADRKQEKPEKEQVYNSVVYIEDKKIPTVVGYRNHKRYGGTESDAIAEYNPPGCQLGEDKAGVEEPCSQAGLEQAEAREPEDVHEQGMVDETVRTAKIWHLKKQPEKIRHTETPDQDAKQV
jgi:hypothetical protein